jgi:PAS domain S-box-containing protein
MNEFPEVLSPAERFSLPDRPVASDPLDDLPVAYVEMDVTGTIIRANRLTRESHASHAGELIGKLAWDLMPTEEQEMSCAAFMSAMETGEDPPVARRSLYTASGQFRVHEIHRNVIRDAEGRSTGMRVVNVDVTDAHRALDEAQRARVWLENVLAALADAVIVTDALGFIRTVNPAAEEMFGWKAAELRGKVIDRVLPLLSYLSDDGKPVSFTMALEKRARGVGTTLDRERREVHVEIGTSPIVDAENGFTIGVVSVFRRLEEAV